MPRNSSGTYTPPVNSWNPAVDGTTIDAADWNAQLTDYTTAFTDSLSRNGDGGMLADLEVDANAILMAEIASPSSPAANNLKLYALDVSTVTKLAYKNSAGTETILTGGDVVGPSSATDNAVARFDLTTGKLIQNSVVTIADTTGAIAGTQSVAVSGSSSGAATITAQVAAGTPTLTLPNASGTFAVSVAAPLSLSATTGAISWAGTSGGIPYFSSATTAASSGALTANGVVIGGGAGVAPSTTAVGTTAQAFTGNTGSAPSFQSWQDTIEFVIDGGGSTITTGVKGDLEIPYGCTITRATLLADQSGSIVVDLWVDTYANYPPTVADSIVASAPPTISTATKSQDSTLTGWTTALASGSTIRYNVNSVTTIQRVVVSLKVTRTTVS